MKRSSQRTVTVADHAVLGQVGLPHRLRIMQNGQEFRVKKNAVYTCAKGTTEEDWNEGNAVAVMRVTELLAA